MFSFPPHTGHKLCCLKPRHSSKLGRPKLCLKSSTFLLFFESLAVSGPCAILFHVGVMLFKHSARKNFAESLLAEVKADPTLASFRGLR